MRKQMTIQPENFVNLYIIYIKKIPQDLLFCWRMKSGSSDILLLDISGFSTQGFTSFGSLASGEKYRKVAEYIFCPALILSIRIPQ